MYDVCIIVDGIKIQVEVDVAPDFINRNDISFSSSLSLSTCISYKPFPFAIPIAHNTHNLQLTYNNILILKLLDLTFVYIP